MKPFKGYIYISVATIAFDDVALDELVHLSLAKNQKLGITGVLYFDRNHFVQYIEGQNNRVSILMQSILADKRHHVLELLCDENTYSRRFPCWNMKKLPNTHIGMNNILFDLMNKKHFMNEKTWPSHVWRSLDKISSLEYRNL